MVNKPRRHVWICNSTDKEMLVKSCLGHLLRNRDKEWKEVVKNGVDNIKFLGWLLEGTGLALAC